MPERNRADNPSDFFNEHADLGGDHARDTHRGGFGDDYARERVDEVDDETVRIVPEKHIGKASE